MKINFIFFYFITIYIKNNLVRSEIVLVFEQFRNGIYKYNSIGDDIETQKINLNLVDKKISPSSMRSSYLLGLFIKEKYGNIINPKINSKNLYIFSKELDIHVLSAQSQLLGMFPLEEGIILNKIEIDLAFPQTAIPLEAQEEINELGCLSVPKSIKPFALRYFSDEEKQHLLSINDDCPRLTKIKQKNIEDYFNNQIKIFNDRHGEELLDLFKISNKTLIEDYHYLSRIIDHFISYYRNKKYLEEKNNLNNKQLNILYQDCIDFKNKSFLFVEATLK